MGRSISQEEIERRIAALREAGGNVAVAARSLGIRQQALQADVIRNPDRYPTRSEPKSNGEKGGGAALRTRTLIRKDASIPVPDNLTPESFARALLAIIDEYRQRLAERGSKLLEFQAKLDGASARISQLEADLSYYKDKEERETAAFRQEVAEAVRREEFNADALR